MQVGWLASAVHEMGQAVSREFHGDIGKAWAKLSRGCPTLDIASMKIALEKYFKGEPLSLENWKELAAFMHRSAGRQRTQVSSIDEAAFCCALMPHSHHEVLHRQLKDTVSENRCDCTAVNVHCSSDWYAHRVADDEGHTRWSSEAAFVKCSTS